MQKFWQNVASKDLTTAKVKVTTSSMGIRPGARDLLLVKESKQVHVLCLVPCIFINFCLDMQMYLTI